MKKAISKTEKDRLQDLFNVAKNHWNAYIAPTDQMEELLKSNGLNGFDWIMDAIQDDTSLDEALDKMDIKVKT